MPEGGPSSLLLFPHAGGSAADLGALAARLHPHFDLRVVELPGRGRRRKESLLYHAAHVLDDLSRYIPSTGNVIFAGHSLGAYLACLAAWWFKQRYPAASAELIVVSNTPIHLRSRQLPEDSGVACTHALLDLAKRSGGLPAFVENDGALRERFLRILHADLSIVDSIDADQALPNRTVPITAIYGSDDPLLDARVQRWGELTDAGSRLVQIHGAHFLPQEAPDALAEIVLKLFRVHERGVE